MSRVQLHLIAAACENMGIGVNGTLPWRLKKEMSFFTSMTSDVKDNKKMNAVVMGRRTWECIPDKYRPLSGRVNIVLTTTPQKLIGKVPEEVAVVSSLDEAIKYINDRGDIESTWVIGGSSVYKATIEHPNCGKIYLTEIHKTFQCDTFFPTFDREQFLPITEEGVPREEQIEGDIRYHFKVYAKRS